MFISMFVLCSSCLFVIGLTVSSKRAPLQPCHCPVSSLQRQRLSMACRSRSIAACLTSLLAWSTFTPWACSMVY